MKRLLITLVLLVSLVGVAHAIPPTPPGTGTISSYADVVTLFGSGSCSGSLQSDGSCSTPPSMVYPGAGIPNSTGSAWGTSFTVDTDLSSVSGSDDTVPSAKATKAALDGKQATHANLTAVAGLTLTAGDIWIVNAAGALERLPKGTEGYLLKQGATIPGWSNTFSAQMDDSAAQFKHADSTATGKIDLQSVTADKGFTLTPVCTDNCVVTTPPLGSGTFTAVIIGQTLVTRTEFIPVAWMIDGAAAPAALATTDLGTRQVKTRAFQADTADQDLEMFWQAPNDIVDGDAAAGFQVKWRPIFIITSATAPAAGEGVAFALQSCSSGNGDTGDCTVGTASVIADADLDAHAQFDVVYGGWTEMTVTDGAASEAWFMKLYRDQDNAIDDYVQAVGLVGIELKYQTKPLNDY